MMCNYTWEPMTQPKRNQTWSFNEMYGGTMALYGGKMYGGVKEETGSSPAEVIWCDTIHG